VAGIDRKRRGLGARPLPHRTDVPGEGQNVSFTYRYRDSAGHSVASTAVLRGPAGANDIQRIREKLDDGWFFIAEQVGLDPLQDQLATYDTGSHDSYDEPDEMGDLDHAWHEVDTIDIVRTNGPPNTTMAWRKLVENFAYVTGWDASLSPYASEVL
jgi:hypothetical protein